MSSTKTLPTAHISEAAFQQRVTNFCDWLGILWHHETDSRRSKGGFPDLVLVGHDGVVFAELKMERGRVSSAQAKWLLALELAGVECHVWQPSDWPAIKARLRDLAAKGGAR